MKKRSEKRQRTILLAARFSPAEAEAVRAKAEPCGGVSPYIRHAALGGQLPRHVADRAAIARLLAELGNIRSELGKSGSNLNQLAHYANMERWQANSIAAAIEEHDQAIRTLQELRLVCLQALGQERNRKPPK
jgi:hypothetical protein